MLLPYVFHHARSEIEADILIKEKRAMHLELPYNVCCIYTDGLFG